jgi:serine protease Do
MKTNFTKIVLAALAAVFTIAGSALAFEPSDTAGVVKKVKRSVIRIQGIDVGAEQASGGYGGGSGVVFQINYDEGTAYALTNHHVSGDTAVAGVRFWNGAEYRAEMIAREPGIDVALLRIFGIPDERNVPDDKKNITASVLGNSDEVRIGDHAIAMGSPGAGEGANTNRSDPFQDFMLQQTVTDGVVTGRDSVIDFPLGIWRQNRNGLGQQYGTNFDYAFRVTVPINGGNSGGPLFNDRGEVIGLNFYGGSSPLMQNMNHTVPINLAKDFAYQILNTGKFEKPWLGVDIIFPPFLREPEQVTEFRDRRNSDALEVFGVRRNSPAARAGFQQGDIILEIDGRRFSTPEEVRRFIFTQPIGKQLSFVVERDGRKLRTPIVAEVGVKRSYDSEFSV